MHKPNPEIQETRGECSKATKKHAKPCRRKTQNAKQNQEANICILKKKKKDLESTIPSIIPLTAQKRRLFLVQARHGSRFTMTMTL